MKTIKIYEETIDKRVPTTANIYYKNNKEILFEYEKDIDATKSGFSKFTDYGIKILTTTNYYYLPKRNLTKEQVFKHALLITKKETNIKEHNTNRTFLSKTQTKNKKQDNRKHKRNNQRR